jgi:uncharacterized membrane protein
MGLGTILIIAHNWDELSVWTKSILAFVPLVLSQIACGYTLLKQSDSETWREVTATFLFLAIGASISLIAQVYNIPGDINSFLVTWLLLGLPVVYLMRSSFSSLLYIAGVTLYAVNSNYWTYEKSNLYLPWLLLFAIAPYYYSIYRKNENSHSVLIHHWFAATALTLCMSTLLSDYPAWMVIAYLNLFCAFNILGHFIQQKSVSHKANGYISIGQICTMLLLLASTFQDFWKEVRFKKLDPTAFYSPEFLAAALTLMLCVGLLVLKKKKIPARKIRPLETVFFFYILLYILSFVFPTLAVFSNLLFLILSVLVIREGIKKEHLGITNLGLLLITTLVACRFFDTDLDFVVRGVLFLIVGLGFFVVNFLMIKKRNG